MYNVYGTICATYEEACIVAGIETPAQLEQEEAWYAIVNEIENLTSQVQNQWCACVRPASKMVDYGDDFIPF